MTDGLTHFNEEGRARMVDVSGKKDTHREAIATGTVYMKPGTLKRIEEGEIAKGDVLAVAQVAGVMGAKKTPDLIPMCHPLLITSVDIRFKIFPAGEDPIAAIEVIGTAKTSGQTGVEMEAITAVSVAALTIYDMCKAIDKGISFGKIALLRKSGGKSGVYTRSEPIP